jgi:hypothetical protein
MPDFTIYGAVTGLATQDIFGQGVVPMASASAM